MRIGREKLYEEVWAEPMTKVAERYQVSGSFLARVCERLNVPRPPRGYWAKLEAGKQPDRPPLPNAQVGDETEWVRDEECPPQLPRVPKPPPEAPAAAAPPPIASAKPHGRARHRLVKDAEVRFEKLREGGEYLKPWKQLMADVFVSRGTLTRALKLANRLYLELECRGHRVVLAPQDEDLCRFVLEHREPPPAPNTYFAIKDEWRPARPTVTYVGSVAIGLTLFEVATLVEVEHRWEEKRYVRWSTLSAQEKRYSWGEAKKPELAYLPCGRLGLRVYSPYLGASWTREWREEQRGTLPEVLDEVMLEIERAAPTIAELAREERRRQEEWRLQREAEERARRQLAEEQRRKEAFKQSRNQLVEIIETWAFARSMDEFFQAGAREAGSLEGEERSAFLSRLEEARQMFGGTAVLDHFKAWRSPRER